jgi:hypothetical protein
MPVKPGPPSGRPSEGNPTSATASSKHVDNEVEDWRTPLVKYLQDPKVYVIEKSDDGRLSLFWIMMSYIV